jgi:hypothetical protein
LSDLPWVTPVEGFKLKCFPIGKYPAIKEIGVSTINFPFGKLKCKKIFGGLEGGARNYQRVTVMCPLIPPILASAVATLEN